MSEKERLEIEGRYNLNYVKQNGKYYKINIAHITQGGIVMLNKVTLVKVKASELKLGDIVARSSGQITSIEFCPIHEIRNYADGRVHIIQKTKGGVTLTGETGVWKVLQD